MKRKIGIVILYGIMAIATISMVVFVVTLVRDDPHRPHEEKIYAKASGQGFQILKNGAWDEFFVKGVNIGAAVPGKWFTEFPEDEQVYLAWFEKIGQMNANTIRIYTLLPPEFYLALDKYNRRNTEAPLWLLQEIWPEENPEGQDYLQKDYVDAYYQEIKHVVDAVHGQVDIPERKGRAYGVYQRDVSAYVLGYLVGRELEPDEVIVTNAKNTGFRFWGEYLSTASGASPSEAWLAMNCDYVLKYEDNTYSSQHPVAIVSWPTLDVLEHDSEWNMSGLKSMEYNDKVAIDINNINTEKKMEAGFFGAYHIYPNYPDFMNNETQYDNYYDEDGRLRYGGYLQEFIATQTKYPTLVAEFGLATGMGNAHTSPDALNHGGLTEEQQGTGIVRMMKAITKEGYAGGIIFEWMDEWAKKTWTTEPYMIPYDRHVYWHNALDPEQNYGLLAMASEEPKEAEYTEHGNGSVIKSISFRHDSTFLYLDISLSRAIDFSQEKVLIGLDTYDRGKGEFKYAEDSLVSAPTGLEFVLDFRGEKNAKILAHPGYNITKNRYSSYASDAGKFEEMSLLIGGERVRKDGSKIEAVYQDGSILNYGLFADNTYYHWYSESNVLHIRLPWGKINISDPSTLIVLDDPVGTDELIRDTLKTVKTEGILTSVLICDTKSGGEIDRLSTRKAYTWDAWDTPEYTERLKSSYAIIKEYFEK